MARTLTFIFLFYFIFSISFFYYFSDLSIKFFARIRCKWYIRTKFKPESPKAYFVPLPPPMETLIECLPAETHEVWPSGTFRVFRKVKTLTATAAVRCLHTNTGCGARALVETFAGGDGRGVMRACTENTNTRGGGPVYRFVERIVGKLLLAATVVTRIYIINNNIMCVCVCVCVFLVAVSIFDEKKNREKKDVIFSYHSYCTLLLLLSDVSVLQSRAIHSVHSAHCSCFNGGGFFFDIFYYYLFSVVVNVVGANWGPNYPLPYTLYINTLLRRDRERKRERERK